MKVTLQAGMVLVFISFFATLANGQSSTNSSAPLVPSQVRPALSPDQLPIQPRNDAAPPQVEEAEKARREALEQEELKLAEETQARGYWVDRSTGLMWAAKDNGQPVTWRKAERYCRDLRLGGFSDWRLGTLTELAGLVDKSDPAPERAGNVEIISINIGRRVKGGLLLRGDPWSSNREIDRFGHPYGDGWFFDFVNAKPSGDLPYFRNTKLALCVRGAQKP